MTLRLIIPASEPLPGAEYRPRPTPVSVRATRAEYDFMIVENVEDIDGDAEPEPVASGQAGDWIVYHAEDGEGQHSAGDYEILSDEAFQAKYQRVLHRKPRTEPTPNPEDGLAAKPETTEEPGPEEQEPEIGRALVEDMNRTLAGDARTEGTEA